MTGLPLPVMEPGHDGRRDFRSDGAERAIEAPSSSRARGDAWPSLTFSATPDRKLVILDHTDVSESLPR